MPSQICKLEQTGLYISRDKGEADSNVFKNYLNQINNRE